MSAAPPKADIPSKRTARPLCANTVVKLFLDHWSLSGLWARRSNNRLGTTATGDELTGNIGSALEGTSIDNYCLVALLAEKFAEGHFWSFATLSAIGPT
jgi:hypothetical protein